MAEMRALSRFAMAVVLGGLLAACATDDPQPLQEGFDKYTARQAQDSERIADAYIRAHPDAADIDQAYYLRGISRMSQGQRAGARADLKVAIDKTTRGDLRSKAYRSLGDMAFDARQFAEANGNYALALDNLSLSQAQVTEINYRMGMSLQGMGEWTKADSWLSKVIAARDNPTLAESALQRLHATHFALQYGAFGDRPAAQALQARLQTAAITAVVVPEVRADNKVWFLVQSGAYAVWAEAAAAKTRLPAGVAPVIVPPLDR